MTTLTVKVQETLARKLRIAAQKQNITRSSLIRLAVEKYIDTDLAASDELSAHDMMKDFCGTVEGPPDLATHPRHMEGFGR